MLEVGAFHKVDGGTLVLGKNLCLKYRGVIAQCYGGATSGTAGHPEKMDTLKAGNWLFT